MTIVKNEDSWEEKSRTIREGVPKLLRVVLGETATLVTLGEFLYDLASLWPLEAGSLRFSLERDHDHPVYRDLLHTTWCYPGEVARKLNAGFTLTQYSKQSDVVDRALDALMCSKGGKKNVLCYGHRQEMGNMRQNSAGVSSGAGKLLLSPGWEVLLSRIGDTLMLYLLLNVSIFLKMKNNCYFQLAGHPIIDNARATRKKSDALMTKFHKKSGIGGSSSGIQDVITQHFPNSISPGDGKAVEDDDQKGTTQRKKSKKNRPSSWQRKKYRKALERNDEITVQRMKYRHHRNTEYITQPFGSGGGKTQQGSLVCRRKVHYRYPRKFQPPSEMIFPREFIFYSTRYARKCGLSSKRM